MAETEIDIKMDKSKNDDFANVMLITANVGSIFEDVSICLKQFWLMVSSVFVHQFDCKISSKIFHCEVITNFIRSQIFKIVNSKVKFSSNLFVDKRWFYVSWSLFIVLFGKFSCTNLDTSLNRY